MFLWASATMTLFMLTVPVNSSRIADLILRLVKKQHDAEEQGDYKQNTDHIHGDTNTSSCLSFDGDPLFMRLTQKLQKSMM